MRLLCVCQATQGPGRELQLEVGIVPLIQKQGCECVVWRVRHLPSSQQEPSTFEKRIVQDCCVVVGWIGGVWIISVALHMQTYTVLLCKLSL